jgi:CRISPR-associated endonuclease Csn1
MPVCLGLDIGSNSVGSAWVDTETREIALGVSVFPAGVDEQEDKRGAPKNQARRAKRSQRRTIDRRARRKRAVLRFLIDRGLFPREPHDWKELFKLNPWELRRRGLDEQLSPFEFGRLLLHMAQRRGAIGVVIDPEDPEEGDVRAGMDRLKKLMKERGAATVGQLLAHLIDERRQTTNGVSWNEPIRNRQYRISQDQRLFAGRELIRQEFHCLVEKQRSFQDSELASLLTDELVRQLDDPRQTKTWRHQGLLFGQRRTYWNTGTLGRCVLEPTDRCVPIADRHASYFRVVETVNNLRIQPRGEPARPLTVEERENVLRLLRGPLIRKSSRKKGEGEDHREPSVTVADIKRVLGIKPRDKNTQLNIEADENRDINTDWFHREIVHGAFTENRWTAMSEEQRESVNRAILRLDPDDPKHIERLRAGAAQWWSLPPDGVERLVSAWQSRPKLEKRLNLSRRAILNLLPYMEKFDAVNKRWRTQQEARKEHAQDLQKRFRQTGDRADQLAAQRYDTGALGLTAADRYYMRQRKHQLKHGGKVVCDAQGHPLVVLPPAPMLSNPVVRKAIHEVRRHILAYLRKFRRKPDRVVIELARITKQSARVRNAVLARNRNRSRIRKKIINDILPQAFEKQGIDVQSLSLNQREAAVDRVILAQQQEHICPYCGQGGLTDDIAAGGKGLEIDHIVPYSRSGDDSMNNRVLVHSACNQAKSNQTPREWWGDGFEKKIQFAQKLFKGIKPDKTAYFTKRDYARKWHNFTREVREQDEFKNSQLTDTAYAARQVAAYLADALFDGRGLPERGDGADQQRIFFTVGRITLMLRKDWQLFDTLRPELLGPPARMTAEKQLELARKNRGDHRQHAIDAVAIALTDPEIKRKLATWAAQAAEDRDKSGKWPKRTPIPAPWGDVASFRAQVLSKLYSHFYVRPSAGTTHDSPPQRDLLIVAHRPVKRRLVGPFHEETHYGPVIPKLPKHRTEDPTTLFTNRIAVTGLKPNHLRVPEGWDELSARLEDVSISRSEKRRIRRQLATMPDPKPEKSGIVRSRELRDQIRKCLRAHRIDPDNFTAAQIKQLVSEGQLTHKSGVPIKGVVLLRTITDPVVIPRKKWDPVTNRMVLDNDPRSMRVYIGGTNHHVEIRERPRTRKGGTVTEWVGEIVTSFDAARRVRIEKRDIVDRSDNDRGRFVMSLAEGEMIYARRKDRPDEPPDYFVVCKLDKTGNSCRIHFAPHWDARKASEQDRWDVTPDGLKDCGPQPGLPPYKVRVSALGEATRLDRD